MTESDRLVTVFETADPSLMALAKSILERARIDYWVREEFVVLVREDDSQRAVTLLAGLHPTGS